MSPLIPLAVRVSASVWSTVLTVTPDTGDPVFELFQKALLDAGDGQGELQILSHSGGFPDHGPSGSPMRDRSSVSPHRITPDAAPLSPSW